MPVSGILVTQQNTATLLQTSAWPIANILRDKNNFEIAKELGLPEFIINKKPSAGLWMGQTDEDEMGFTYEVLDAYIRGEKTPEPK